MIMQLHLDTNSIHIKGTASVLHTHSTHDVQHTQQVTEHFLIDTENMGREWVKMISPERENTIYHVFYTQNSPAISIECVEKILHQHHNIEFIKCYTGAQGLDFQLVSLLGYMLSQNPKDRYYIVAKDIGYDAVVKFWTDRRMPVQRIFETQTSNKDFSEDLTLKEECKEVLKGVAAGAEVDKVVGIISKATASGTTSYKTMIHTKLVQTFSQEKGRQIYHACKNIMEQAYLNQGVS